VGDIGHFTRDKALVISGRKEDIINRGGEKISAKEIEDILHHHADVVEAAIVSMPHERLGETLCAYVIARPEHALTLQDVCTHIAASGVAKQKLPERLVVVETLPRNPSGKIRKDLLRQDICERIEKEKVHLEKELGSDGKK
jgi:non-ribosomal peptide synthetase component E (peptide arylation enzyme)